MVSEIVHKPTKHLEQAKIPPEVPFARRADSPALWLPKTWRRHFLALPSPWEWIGVAVVWALVAVFFGLALRSI